MTIGDPEILEKLDVLVRTFWPYMGTNKQGWYLQEDAPENVKQAYQEYLDINDSFKIQS